MTRHEEDDQLDGLLKDFERGHSRDRPRIMIVDDDSDIRNALAESLSGYEIIGCSSGEEAIESIDTQIQCVIMDVKMPGMSGFEATRRIHERYPDTPIMIHTGYQNEHTISDVVELGVHGYIPKGSHNINDIRLKLSSLCEIFQLRKERKLYQDHLEELVADQTRLLKETQHHLMAAESMAAVGRAMGGTSHNIKNATMTLTSTIDELGDLYGRLENDVAILARREDWGDIKCIGDRIRNYHMENDRDPPDEVRRNKQVINKRLREEGLPAHHARDLAKCNLEESDLDSILHLIGTDDAETVVRYLRDSRDLGVNINLQKKVQQRIFRAVRAIKHNMQDISTYVEGYDVHQGLESAVELLSYPVRRRITFKRDFGEIEPVNAYPGLLNQVWHYVIGNAIEAIEDEGAIEISTRMADEKVQVTISDNGIGIREEYLAKVFNPYFTTKGNGIGGGLGLSYAYNIMNEYGGSIQIDSGEGKGTDVNIQIPRQPAHTPDGR